MATKDNFQSLKQLPVETTEKVAERLEFRGVDPAFVHMREDLKLVPGRNQMYRQGYSKPIE